MLLFYLQIIYIENKMPKGNRHCTSHCVLEYATVSLLCVGPKRRACCKLWHWLWNTRSEPLWFWIPGFQINLCKRLLDDGFRYILLAHLKERRKNEIAPFEREWSFQKLINLRGCWLWIACPLNYTPALEVRSSRSCIHDKWIESTERNLNLLRILITHAILLFQSIEMYM